MGKSPTEAQLQKRIQELEKENEGLREQEETLRRTADMYRIFATSTHDVFWTLDLDTMRFTFVSPSVEYLTGFTAEESMKRSIADILTPESYDRAIGELKEALEKEKNHSDDFHRQRTLEWQEYHKQGHTIWVGSTVSFLRDEDGRPHSVIGLSRDITERKEAQEALRESEAKYRALFDNAADLIAVIDLDGNILDLNEQFEEESGYRRSEAIGKNVFKNGFITEQSAKKAFSHLQDLLAGQAGRIFNVEGIRKDGMIVSYELRAVPIREDGKVVAVQAILRNITERKRAEEALLQENEKFLLLTEKSPYGVSIIDRDGHYKYLNPKFIEMFGYALEDIPTGATWFNKAYPDELAKQEALSAWKTDLRTFKEGEFRPRTFEVTCKDGSRKTITFTAVTMETGDQFIIYQDITKRMEAERATNESEEKYRTILDSIEEGYFEVDLPGNLTFFNDSLCKMTGYSREELMGLNNRDYTTPETSKRMYQVFNEVYRTGLPANVSEYDIIRKDGSTCIFEMSTSLVRDAKGKPVGFRGIVRDITDRKQAEKALRESEERYRQLLNHAPAGIFEVDYREQKFVTVNDVMCRYTGYTREEFLALNPFDILTEESKMRFMERLNRILAGEKVPETVEFTIRGKGGREFWVMLNARFVYEDGILKGATVVVHDITDRKLADEALRKSEERYRLLVDNANDGIFIAQDGRIKFPNPKTLEVVGYTASELERIPYFDLIHPEDRDMFAARQKKRREGEENLPGTYTLRVVNKAGEELWTQVSAVPIHWEGRPATLNFVRDITPQKRLEEQLLQAQKMEAIGTIAGGVAHNFRNILAVISMKSQLVQMKYPDHPSLQEIAQGINTYVDRGVHLVEGLMQFCRKEAKRELKPINLCGLLQETYGLISKSFDKIIDIRSDIPESLTIMADSAGLSQVLMNLCTNARDAMPKGGVLEIGARQEEDRAVVTVSDTGLGMSKDDLEKCFDPFFTTKEPGKGTGLGLSTTYGIIKEHGGHIQVQSKLNEGTTFTLSFPLASTEQQPGDLPASQAVQGTGQKILIVDDELEICKVMEELLAEFGYQVTSVTNGKAGIAQYKTWCPDVVLLDRNMPEMDGLSFAQSIMEHDPAAKIVIISGYDEDGPLGINEEGRKLIRGYLTKPVSMTELSSLMAELL
jgi:PAS domain S-box-containing protein